MKKTVLALYLGAATLAGAEMTAREVIDEQARRHKLTHETTVMTVTLIDRKGFRDERTLRRLDKDRGNDLVSSLTIFDAPSDVKGTALLTRENEGKPNDQWLYFPSQRRLQRIAQARRNGYFMGTDFTYEDMDPESIDNYAYRHVRSETLDGMDCFVIEAVPANEKQRRSSGYGRRLLWIRKDIFFTVRIEYFDRRNKLIKTQVNSELENLQGDVWRAGKSFVDNLAKHHQTEVVATSRDMETELPESTFTDRNLLTGRYMK
jgi:hypothetical protein